MAAGRRTSLSSLAGGKVESVPGQTDPILVRFPLDKVVPTPLNPRTDFGGTDSLTELGESMRKRQLQPVVVISRVSYLKLFSEHAEQIGAASHVIITGERRYRGACQVGLDGLEAVILEEIATSRQDVLDAVLSENIDRKNFDPIEEALAVQVMVKECGKAAAAAERFRRTGGWVSQRLALLRLVPEAQALVRAGQMPVREARGLAAHPEHEQMLIWREKTREKAAEREAAKATVEAPAPGLPRQDAPLASTALPDGRAADAGSATVLRSVPQAAAEQPLPERMPERTPPPVPAQAPPAAEAGEHPASELAWVDDPDLADVVHTARSLVQRFTRDERMKLTEYLLRVAKQERLAEEARTSVSA